MVCSAGCSFFNWLALLLINKFRVGFKYIPLALLVTFVTSILYPFVLLEKLIYDKRIKKIKVISPIFIIGHMRSGTTFLHYIMSKDKNLGYSTTTEAIFPWVFLTLNKFIRSFMRYVLPEKRPMDNMKIEEDMPQEEELGVANLTIYSPNNGAYFPKKIEEFYTKYSFFEGVKDKVIKRWKKTYLYYLQKLTLKNNGKRFLSKNLVNSCRIKYLIELFPDAKFIYIYRNPYKVFLSSKKLYKKFIFPNMAFQSISDEKLEEIILKTERKTFEKYLEQKDLVKKGNIYEIKFEDFVKEPLKHLEKIYKELNIGGFEESRSAFAEFAKQYENYKPDKYNIEDNLRENIYKELKFIFDKYGYEK